MCGIAGLYDAQQPPDRSLMERLAAPLACRGPDGFGFTVGKNVGLAHQRLAVIDVAGGAQPIFNEDRTLAVVFNGEIYDYAPWRAELEALGHRFTTHSDTEVLLHLYEEHGPDFVRDLNGMFAFAICHLDTGRLFLARDRLGKKPLFYAESGGRFAFASGPASLATLPWVNTQLDAGGIADYLEYLYVPTPRSIYEGIHKVPPGYCGWWNEGRLTIEPYWTPKLTGDYPGTLDAARHELRQALDGAVRRRLVADVPLGLFLSGGVDSSVVCALAQRALGQPAKTFSIGFPEAAYDERRYAALVAKHLGTEHHFLEVNAGDFSHLEKVVRAFEEPYADSSMLPTYLLSQFARSQVTVALTGDGADELFGGYYRYRVMHVSEPLRRVPQSWRAALRRVALALLPAATHERTRLGRLRRLVDISAFDGLERYQRIMSRFPDELKRELGGDRLLQAQVMPSLRVLERQLREVPEQAWVDRVMELDLKTYLADDLLVKADRASMAWGLEVRSPFLDREVVDLALRLPYEFKQFKQQRKRVLQAACADLLPPEIFSRAKMGFGVPVATWLRTSWRTPAADLLLGGRLTTDGWLRRDRLERCLTRHANGQADSSYAIFALLVLEIWLRQAQR